VKLIVSDGVVWYCRAGSGTSGPGPVNVIVAGAVTAAGSAGPSHLQRLSPLRSDTEFSR